MCLQERRERAKLEGNWIDLSKEVDLAEVAAVAAEVEREEEAAAAAKREAEWEAEHKELQTARVRWVQEELGWDGGGSKLRCCFL